MKKCTRNAQENPIKIPYKKEDDLEAYLSYKKDNYVSRVNATNLLALERGLLQHLNQVKESLEAQYSSQDQRTVREVLESDEVAKCL